MLRSTSACLVSLCLSLCASVALHAQADPSPQRAVRVGLHASWPATAPAFEVAEWLAGHVSEPVFWTFIRQLAARKATSETDRDEHDRIASALAAAVDEGDGNSGMVSIIAQWALTARLMSPRVQLHRVLAREAIEVLGGNATQNRRPRKVVAVVATNMSDTPMISLAKSSGMLKSMIQGDSCVDREQQEVCTVSPDDHWVHQHQSNQQVQATLPGEKFYPAPHKCARTPGPRLLVLLYADPSDTEFVTDWHEPLVEAVSNCKVEYALRLWDGDSERSPSTHVGEHSLGLNSHGPALQGFAIEVALKSTEYTVIDDAVFGSNLFGNCPYGDFSCANFSALPLEPRSVDKNFVDFDIGAAKKALDNEFGGLIAAGYISERAAGDPRAAVSELRRFVEDLPVAMLAASRTVGLGLDDDVVTTDSDSEDDDEDDDDGEIDDGRGKREVGKRSRLGRWQAAASAALSVPGLVDSIFINGRPILASVLVEDLTSPMECLAGVARTASTLRRLFNKQKREVVERIPSMLKTAAKDDLSQLRFDVSMDGEFDDVPFWFNDLRVDSRYKKWVGMENGDNEDAASATLTKYVSLVEHQEQEYRQEQEYQQGNARFEAAGPVKVRSNVVSLLSVLDLGNSDHVQFLRVPDSVVRGMIPLRVGLAVVPTTRASTVAAAVYFHCIDVGGVELATRYLNMFSRVLDYFGGGMRQVATSEELIEIVFQQLVQQPRSTEQIRYSSAGHVLEGDKSVRDRLLRMRHWAYSVGLVSSTAEEWSVVMSKNSDSPTLLQSFKAVTLLNGIVLRDVSADVLSTIMKEHSRIAALAKQGSGDASLKFFPQNTVEDTVLHWLSLDKSLIVVRKLAAADSAAEDAAGGHARLSLVDMAALVDATAAVEYLALEHRTDIARSPTTVSVWFIPGGETPTDYENSDIQAVRKFAGGKFALTCGVRCAIIDSGADVSEAIRKAVSGISSAQSVLVVNGIVYRQDHALDVADLEIAVAREALTYASAAASVLGDTADPTAILFGVLALRDVDSACGIGESVVADDREKQRPASLATLLSRVENGQAQPFYLTAEQTESFPADLSIAIVVDPIGKYALPVSAFVETLIDSLEFGRVDVMMLLTPPIRLQRPGTLRPVFSRMVYSSKPDFNSGSGALVSPAGVFLHLPQSTLLTVGILSPRAWFVSPHATNYDLDNVILSSLPSGVSILHAEYALESMLVEGSCVDENHAPPQGLRLQMTSSSRAEIDTLVMANLGYFQFLTSPGRWELQIAGGRGRDIFDMKSIRSESGYLGGGQATARNGRASAFVSDSNGRVFVLVDSLSGARNSLLRVARKHGMEDVPLLDPALVQNDVGVIRGSPPRRVAGRLAAIVKKVFRGRRIDSIDKPLFPSMRLTANVAENGSARSNGSGVHVFSVASGHLYERFLKIMMLSVTKHTSEPVTFWLLENYLSPSFKKVVPMFAAEHGFSVRMVTYRWPSWLREQTEKQRVIWAYKILFLDVLFPLGLRRVIFVDSDQVVRGDLAKLMRLDLQGAPYGYVPFCDSRKEVEGFRFWKTGFWKDVLQGAAYHISALYVVDLDRFRETSAGDSLRYIYQSLSADPNSLSNLDQDLPNYASVSPSGGGQVVPIFDLPQEWLWCESWCDDASKIDAETIDLCNNPMTKEPKLDSAKRIIKEWTTLDTEAFDTSNKIVNELAGRFASFVPGSASPLRDLRDRRDIVDSDDGDDVKFEL
jgi:Glucosyltransferase 24/UDP-glucose:Glycoprotein Glucosyltransferase/Thioredoxin-like domain